MLRRPNQKVDAAAAISGVDQRLRECLQALWLALPPERANVVELEQNFTRFVNRAMRDLEEDLELFPPDENKRDS